MAFKQANSREAWETFLEELAHAIATEGKMKHASVVKSLKTHEYIQCTHQCLQWAFDNQQQGAITFVEIDAADGNQVEKAIKEDVEQACMAENEQQFRQANDTPFMMSLLVEDFGYLGIGENTQAVLAGTYIPPPGTNKYAAMLLEQLKIPDHVRTAPLCAFIMTEQFIAGW